MKVLRARLYEVALEEQQKAIASDRKSQVGSGDRSEKIRTYNFQQARVTDHRIGLTLHRLQEMLDGDLEEIVGGLIAHHQARSSRSLHPGRGAEAAALRADARPAHDRRGPPARGRRRELRDGRRRRRRSGTPSGCCATSLGWDRGVARRRTRLASSTRARGGTLPRARRPARAPRVPLQHLVGTQAFWRHEFVVTPDVLDPAPGDRDPRRGRARAAARARRVR